MNSTLQHQTTPDTLTKPQATQTLDTTIPDAPPVEKGKSSSPMGDAPSVPQDKSASEPAQPQGKETNDAAPTTAEIVGAPLGIEIDPSLLDGSLYADIPAELSHPVVQPLKTKDLTPIDQPSAWLHPEAFPPIGGSPSPQDLQPKVKAETLAQRWNLNTDVSSTGPNSTSSLLTPEGSSLYSPGGESSFDLSRDSSFADLKPFSQAGQGESGALEGGTVPPPPKKKSHARKQADGHIKRARNAFILFRKHITDSGLIPPSVEVKHQNISVVAAKMWKEAPQDVRRKFQEQARIEKEEHQRMYPGYRYQPVFRRTDIVRRRVRKDAAEDDKVEAVAEALIKGKSGGQLEKEIKEQMVSRGSGAESGSEAESVKSMSRRRRRDQGEMSKGAIRAQKAQNRAKQMRQNLLGSNLYNISMYNAQQEQQELQRRRSLAEQMHQQHQFHQDEGMLYPPQSWLPVGYDHEGRPMLDHPYMQYGSDVEEDYRLPPIMGYEAGQGWESGYYPEAAIQDDYYPHPPSHLLESYGQPHHPSINDANMQYQLPPIHHDAAADMEASRRTELRGSLDLPRDAEDPQEDLMGQGEDPRMKWKGEETMQTPSGHVIFNERLFDGALPSANEDGLGSFEEAVSQANDLPNW